MNTFLPKSMLAVVVERNGGRPVAREIPVPVPGPGEVLVRMAAAPINPSDTAFMNGLYGAHTSFPVVPGFEGSGTVAAAGPGLFPRLLLGRRGLLRIDSRRDLGGISRHSGVSVRAPEETPFPGARGNDAGESADRTRFIFHGQARQARRNRQHRGGKRARQDDPVAGNKASDAGHQYRRPGGATGIAALSGG